MLYLNENSYNYFYVDHINELGFLDYLEKASVVYRTVINVQSTGKHLLALQWDIF